MLLVSSKFRNVSLGLFSLPGFHSICLLMLCGYLPKHDFTVMMLMPTDDTVSPQDVVACLCVNNFQGFGLLPSCLSCLQHVMNLLHSEELSLTYLHASSAYKGQTTRWSRTSSGSSSLVRTNTVGSSPSGQNQVSKNVLKTLMSSRRNISLLMCQCFHKRAKIKWTWSHHAALADLS